MPEILSNQDLISDTLLASRLKGKPCIGSQGGYYRENIPQVLKNSMLGSAGGVQYGPLAP